MQCALDPHQFPSAIRRQNTPPGAGGEEEEEEETPAGWTAGWVASSDRRLEVRAMARGACDARVAG